MNKLEKLKTGFVVSNGETGEDLENGIDVIINITEEERKREWKRLFYLKENYPEQLSVKEWEKIAKVERINLYDISSFSSYHQTNDDFDLELFESGLSMKSFYYFKKIICLSCSNTYTLKISKHGRKNINRDEQIAKLLDISISTWRKIKAELINFKLLKVIKFEDKKYYKINPCYIRKKKIITPHTYYAFREELIEHKLLSKTQVIYWDTLLKEEYPE